MKRTRLLNSELSHAISRMGHTDSLTLCDAGLPIPTGVTRIDLALERGDPSFLTTLDVILSELQVEEIVVARELAQQSPTLYEGLIATLRSHGMEPTITTVPHEEFKILTHTSEAIVRTGECTPYANVILKSGVVF
jgi:D-ribose pyranase